MVATAAQKLRVAAPAPLPFLPAAPKVELEEEDVASVVEEVDVGVKEEPPGPASSLKVPIFSLKKEEKEAGPLAARTWLLRVSLDLVGPTIESVDGVHWSRAGDRVRDGLRVHCRPPGQAPFLARRVVDR